MAKVKKEKHVITNRKGKVLYNLAPRSSFWFTRLLNVFGGKSYWTTIGDTMYYPDDIEDPFLYKDIIMHEEIHVEQYQKYGIFLFLFLYALVPLPVFFAYFRWKLEREAYMVDLESGATIEEVVNALVAYGRPWPKSWMRKWFEKELAKI